MDTLGIDVSKATFHAHLIGAGVEAKKAFPNSTTGYNQLAAWLKNRGAERVHACMEATGAYWEALALDIHTRGHIVSVVNPARVRAFAQSELLRAKTDAVDAALIARFCVAHKPEPWTPPAPELRKLQALTRHLEDLKTARTQQLNRLKTPGAPTVIVDSLKQIVATLEAEIKKVEDAIDDHFEQHPDLQQKRNLLNSIPGIGPTTSAMILAELADAERFHSSRSVAAYAGLSPLVRQSGSSIHRRARLCKTGNPRLRKGLYLPALSARRHHPELAAFANRLIARGKRPMVVIGALMRKLLILAYALLRSGRPYVAKPA